MQNINEKIDEKNYLKNATKIHSIIRNLVACILFLEQVFTVIIQILFSPPYLTSYLTTIFLYNIFISQGAGKTFSLNIFVLN